VVPFALLSQYLHVGKVSPVMHFDVILDGEVGLASRKGWLLVNPSLEPNASSIAENPPLPCSDRCVRMLIYGRPDVYPNAMSLSRQLPAHLAQYAGKLLL